MAAGEWVLEDPLAAGEWVLEDTLAAGEWVLEGTLAAGESLVGVVGVELAILMRRGVRP